MATFVSNVNRRWQPSVSLSADCSNCTLLSIILQITITVNARHFLLARLFSVFICFCAFLHLFLNVKLFLFDPILQRFSAVPLLCYHKSFISVFCKSIVSFLIFDEMIYVNVNKISRGKSLPSASTARSLHLLVR